eukprot:CAMPEP_0119548240 /NCGR_PEP_ID=MMETSP1352-20130426/2196_1 /TAXON_ID=265584 /ORGANISM="Stauroneis constricta, Strain CCMP1120" /LENGTH=51 /DNA_ID=CAMNT_0007593443 /DNA_START=112 /DNA_END=263 /DNA_ORIENTATION=-
MAAATSYTSPASTNIFTAASCLPSSLMILNDPATTTTSKEVEIGMTQCLRV